MTPVASTLTRPAWQRSLRAVLRSALYEFHKVAAFRTGFLVREVLRSCMRPVIMAFVFQAIYAQGSSSSIRGYTLEDTLRYLILAGALEALLFHERLLDLADQIFQGQLTKYLVLPVRVFTLALGRFVQHTFLQACVVLVLWTAGALLWPELWPRPVSPSAALEALTLALLGSYAFLLVYWIINALAFWLDVIWSLLVLVRFVSVFLAGGIFPVAMMPAGLARALEFAFPFWTVAGPIEIFLGRRGTGDFGRGVLVQLASIAVLELVRRRVWNAGRARYAGSGA